MSAGKGDGLRKGADMKRFRASIYWLRSLCCGARVDVQGDTTKWHVCRECKKPCDIK